MMKPDQVKELRNQLWLHLEGVEYGFAPPLGTGVSGVEKTAEYLGLLTGEPVAEPTAPEHAERQA